MKELISICLVFMNVISAYPVCETPYHAQLSFYYEPHSPYVCGTDNVTYGDIFHLRCTQLMEYGKRVNLQWKHDQSCQTGEYNGYETHTVFVSKLCTNNFHFIP